MKAIVQNGYGSPGVLRLGDVAQPAPAQNEVLVRVHAASLNARDWHVMRGDPYIARLMLPELPLRGPKNRILGTDFAGQVVAAGPDVTGLHPGDNVYGEADGAFAEYVCAPRDVLGAMPANLTYEQAAAVPLAGNTALVCLRDEAGLTAGQRLLINGASGGVGTFAVQVGKALGAEVTAVCSARNTDLVRSLGADHLIDYRQEDFTRTGRRYDVVFDLVSNRSLTALRRTVEPDGTLVLSGGGTSTGVSLIGPMGLFIRGMLAARFVPHRLIAPTPKPTPDRLAALRELIETGRIAPAIDRTYPLSEAPEAIRHLEVEHARAKVVLTV
ncbi:NADPH:quinone reductase [Parafrankia soli]|uniref:NADPH:quinone reductase n=1 Tax=Parafrankia soli TaxID=2599596 RepID=A0A1S1PGS7_9ACTN|nr:NAD(P)-dependent alcohol dehydrogenase [Parafrankia soli]OHV20496.1 NADPH:quinone reductase [Parafrankia soli]